jgi:transcriptional regulator with XRE-family HTH domain
MGVKPPVLATTYQGVLGAVISSLRSSGEEATRTQGKIAEKLDVTVSTWSRIERGESPLSLEQLLIVADQFKIPLSKLFQIVEVQIEKLRKQGINVATSKEALNENSALQISNSQLLAMGILAAIPGGPLGIAAYAVYKTLLKPSAK